MRRYVAALRAFSAVRLPPGHDVAMSADTPYGTARVRIRTTYESYGTGEVPRAIWFEVVGEAPTMEEAREAFQRLAEAIASVLAFTMNAAIEPLTPTVIFDATPSRKRHEYWQFVQPPFAGLPRHSRVLDDKGFEAVVAALVVNTHTDAIQRAIGHFRRAVSHTLPGEWLLAVAHGWMGFEALKPVALKQELERLGWTKAQLAAAWGVTTSVLENEARLRLLFPGRSGLHHRSRNTSNNLEHSLTELGPG